MHAWHIDEREYERHEARRGRRHAFEHVIPAHTALIVVDMIPFFVDENRYARAIVGNVSALAAELRGAGGLVAWVIPAESVPTPLMVEFYGAEVAARYSVSGGCGTLRERLWHELAVDDGDLVVEKTAASAFFPGRCELPALLAARQIDTVLITGTVANVCCESSARDAQTLGYRVIMVADANAAAQDAHLNASLCTVYRSFGDVRTTAELIAMVRSPR